MIRITAILFGLLITISGCSDFFNAKTPQPGRSDQPKDMAEGENPFEPGFDPNEGEYSESKMLANMGLNVIAPMTKGFRLEAEVLKQGVADLCVAAKRGEDSYELALTAAQDAWKRAMLSYHRLDAVPIGPVRDKARFLSDNIYSWPTQNYCGVDLEVARLAAGNVWNPRLFYSLKGLGAIEYLLFETELKTQCHRSNSTHAPAFEWQEKTPASKRLDRCRFAEHLSGEVVSLAQNLEKAWSPEGSNFSKTLIDGSRYESIHEAVNAMSDAIFHFEAVKDQRLGRPLGLHRDCLNTEGKCPELVEHSWSGLAIAAVRARTEGFRNVFWGGENPMDLRYGFDDQLRVLGREEIVSSVEHSVQSIFGSLKELDSKGTLKQQIEQMNPSLCAETSEDTPHIGVCLLHSRFRQLSRIMKTEFLLALALRAPPSQQGDND